MNGAGTGTAITAIAIKPILLGRARDFTGRFAAAAGTIAAKISVQQAGDFYSRPHGITGLVSGLFAVYFKCFSGNRGIFTNFSYENTRKKMKFVVFQVFEDNILTSYQYFVTIRSCDWKFPLKKG